MVVLRCPYCGEKIRQGEKFCPHCGKEISKPHIDEVSTASQDVGNIMISIIGFIVLWFVIGLIVGFIAHSFNLFPAYSPWLLIIPTFLNVVVFLIIKLK